MQQTMQEKSKGNSGINPTKDLKKISEIRERYLRDPLPIRLGGLAANLARINSFSKNINNKEAAESLVNECKYFIEWTADEAEMSIKEYLVKLQIEFALWQLRWDRIWIDDKTRAEIASSSKLYSEKLLVLSGLASG